MITVKIQKFMSLILVFGMILSASCVLIGGLLFLYQHGHESLQAELLLQPTYQTSFFQILMPSWPLTAVNIIQIGIAVLVLTQLLRVLLLCGFYLFEKDISFSIISLFILIVLIFSLSM